MSSILQLPATEQLSLILKRRLHSRLQLKSNEELFLYLADTIYKEQKRLQDGNHDAHIKYIAALKTATRMKFTITSRPKPIDWPPKFSHKPYQDF